MQIVVDKNLPLVSSAFRGLGELFLLDTPDIDRASVQRADMLIVRSDTKVNNRLLDGSRVRFVGTATIGTDHIDVPYLMSRGIAFASSPGSNANSVKEYVLAALLTLASRTGTHLQGRTIGVVGVGNIGARVARLAKALGMVVLQNDPPLARTTGGEGFVSLDDVLNADIVTIHVPLTMTGEDATFHLFNARRLSAMKRGSILLNTSRGGVVETDALKDALRSGHFGDAVLDVWEGEPTIDAGLLDMVALGTPHIAGYSLDGKVNAVEMIRESVRRFLGITEGWEPELPAPEVACVRPEPAADDEETLRSSISRCYDIELDDSLLRRITALTEGERGEHFKQIRKNYRMRREFSATEFEIPAGHERLRSLVEAAGFRPGRG